LELASWYRSIGGGQARQPAHIYLETPLFQRLCREQKWSSCETLTLNDLVVLRGTHPDTAQPVTVELPNGAWVGYHAQLADEVFSQESLPLYPTATKLVPLSSLDSA
ncbi:MAG: hypothetical protein AABY13_01490, partial [Nanoarchaeota archaeon]